MPHATGWIPDPPDDRDYSFKTIRTQLKRKAKIKETPPKADVLSIMSPIRNQGELGSCTAQAIGVGLAESIEIEHYRDPFIPLSPLFLYYVTRARMRQAKVDSGATIRSAMKAAASFGICPEELWPYQNIEETFDDRPPRKAYTNTERFRIKDYWRLKDLNDIKFCIACRNPVVLGIYLFSSFESKEVEETGIIPMPKTSRENLLGGHAVMIAGYSDEDRRVTIRNSWGDWGAELQVGGYGNNPKRMERGYGFLPYEYFEGEETLAADFWTATL